MIKKLVSKNGSKALKLKETNKTQSFLKTGHFLNGVLLVVILNGV